MSLNNERNVEQSLELLNNCKSGKRKRIENPEDHVFEPPKKLYALDVENLPVPIDPIIIHGEDSEETVENVDSSSEEEKMTISEESIEAESENEKEFNEEMFKRLLKEMDEPEDELQNLNRSNEKMEYKTMEKLEHNIGDLLGEQETNEGIQSVMKLSELWIKEVKPKLLGKVSKRCDTPEGDCNEKGACEVCEKPNPKVTKLDWTTLDLTDLYEEIMKESQGSSEDNPIIL